MDDRAMALLGAFLLGVLPACGGDHPTTPNTFSGHWHGHTRRLIISPDGRGREIVDSGCCTRVVTAQFRVLHVTGTATGAVARVKFTSVRIDKKIFAETHRRPPQAGDLGTLRLRHGVVTDESTTVTFCAINVDKCGL